MNGKRHRYIIDVDHIEGKDKCCIRDIDDIEGCTERPEARCHQASRHQMNQQHRLHRRYASRISSIATSLTSMASHQVNGLSDLVASCHHIKRGVKALPFSPHPCIRGIQDGIHHLGSSCRARQKRTMHLASCLASDKDIDRLSRRDHHTVIIKDMIDTTTKTSEEPNGGLSTQKQKNRAKLMRSTY